MRAASAARSAVRLGRRRLDRAKHRALERADRPPVLVFSWSKTGSTTVYESLARSHLRRPVYHVHELDQQIEDRLRVNAVTKGDLGPSRRELEGMLHLRGRIAAGADDLTLVTMVREPVGRAVSSFFQAHRSTGIDMTRHEPDPADVATTAELLHGRLVHLIESTDRWFDRQMLAVFGVDLFEVPFDTDRGVLVHQRPTFRQAVIRLDRLDEAWSTTLPELLGRRVGPLRPANVGAAKRYGAHLRATMEGFRLTPEELDAAASSRVVRHFFSGPERDGLVRRWSSPGLRG